MAKTRPSIVRETSEKEWQARSDADTLIEAKALQADPSRFNAAVKIAGSMSSEFSERADMAKRRALAVKSIANMKSRVISKSKTKK